MSAFLSVWHPIVARARAQSLECLKDGVQTCNVCPVSESASKLEFGKKAPKIRFVSEFKGRSDLEAVAVSSKGGCSFHHHGPQICASVSRGNSNYGGGYNAAPYRDSRAAEDGEQGYRRPSNDYGRGRTESAPRQNQDAGSQAPSNDAPQRVRNRVELIGRIGVNPEARPVGSGNAILCKFPLAVSAGAEKDPYWFDVECWGPVAMSIAENAKGAEVAVTGFLKKQNWTDRQTNQPRSAITVVCQSFDVLSPGGRRSDYPGGEGGGPEPQAQAQPYGNPYQPPEAPAQQYGAPYQPNSSSPRKRDSYSGGGYGGGRPVDPNQFDDDPDVLF